MMRLEGTASGKGKILAAGSQPAVGGWRPKSANRVGKSAKILRTLRSMHSSPLPQSGWWADSRPVPSDSVPLRVGLVGATRRRNGLGPFLASMAEAAGGRVVGVAARDSQRAVVAAGSLVERLGHPVAAFGSALLLAQGVDLLIVATPAEVHADGLLAALAAGVPCLCEKPLVPAATTGDGVALLGAFAVRDLLLVENCQWPAVLPALFALHPELVGQPVRSVAMGLWPPEPGAAMVADSLSHLLSVLQALVPAAQGPLAAIEVADRHPAAVRNRVRFTVDSPTGPILAELHLEHGPHQPRPAWLAVNGRRIDRKIGPGYALAFAAGERAIAVADPLAQLVYGVLGLCRRPDLERIRTIHRELRTRLDWYAAVLAACG